MTLPYLEKVGDTVLASGNGTSGSVPLGDAYPLFEAWCEEYQSLCRSNVEAGAYLDLGRKMVGWLESSGLWTVVGEHIRNTGFLEIRVLPDELRWTEDAAVQETCRRTRLFLDLPWEILAEDSKYLAENPGLPFCPIRRIGRPNGNAPAPAPYRLSMVFMAASPEDVEPVLDFELEEAAILQATYERNLELVVEESGNLDQLAGTLGELCKNLDKGQMGADVLHLSCHGTAERVDEPLLLLEDDLGAKKTATATNLLRKLGLHKPKFLFLSACQTARAGENGAVSEALAQECVRYGMPAVLGWGESVADKQAAQFASSLYHDLSLSGDLEASVARARYNLLVPEDKKAAPANGWHLARLYLGPDGGGVLANGTDARLKLTREHGIKEFLDTARQQVPVASRLEFVGRRRDIQKILREFNSPKHAGVFVHGTGRQGKSSLAARVAARMPRHTVVVVYGPKELGGDQSVHYTAGMILEAIGRKDLKKVSDVVEKYREEVRHNPSRLRPALKEILTICKKAQTPLLLVVDDFEQALQTPEKGGTDIHTVKPHCAPAIAALIEAFADHTGASRLLFTCRNLFSLPPNGYDLATKLMPLNLLPMQERESRKQALAKNVAGGETLDAGLEARIIKAVQGNAGLQDRLFRLGVEDAQACAGALGELETYLEQGKDPEQEDVRAHLDDIFAQTTFDLLSAKERAILRASTLFRVPVPKFVVGDMVRALRIAAQDDDLKECFARLVAFGLWDTLPDYFDEKSVSVMVAPLAAPRAVGNAPMGEAEAKAVASATLPALYAHWGGKNGGKRPFRFDEELIRLGVLAKNAEVLNTCCADALRSLDGKTHYGRLAENALKAVEIVRDEMTPDPELLFMAAQICQSGGKIEKAMKMASEAVEAYESADVLDDDIQYNLAAARLRLARLLEQTGNLDKALAQLEKASGEFASLKRERDKAITLGYIARIYVSKGKVDEALKLHLERREVYEQLGDTRERAVTLGDIARIYVSKGKVDEALKLHLEELHVYEQLGATRERAITLGDIARIYRSQGKVDEALTLYQEIKDIFEQLGATKERAITLGEIARIYRSQGKVDEALTLHQEALHVYEQLGDTKARAVTLGDIARIYVSKGKVDEALSWQEERLRVNEGLGEVDGIAAASFDIAQILLHQKKEEQALPLLQRSFDLFLSIGRVEGIFVVGELYAGVLLAREEKGQVLQVLGTLAKVCETLGDREKLEQIRAVMERVNNS